MAIGLSFLSALRQNVRLRVSVFTVIGLGVLAAFLGEALEGFVIDSDHWRHFLLLLCMIWVLRVAAVRRRRQLYALVPTGGRSYVGAT